MSASKGERSAVNLRLNRYLKRRVEKAAQAAGVDVNTWINRCLRDEVSRVDKENDTRDLAIQLKSS